MLIEHMRKGYSFESFGAVIDIADGNLYEWLKVHPEFQEAKKLAFTHSRLFWEKVGIEGLRKDPDGSSLNTTLWIFNMKNRFGWRDQIDIEQHSTHSLIVEHAKGEDKFKQ